MSQPVLVNPQPGVVDARASVPRLSFAGDSAHRPVAALAVALCRTKGRCAALVVTCGALALAGCKLGPNYVQPIAPVTSTYKELDTAGWKPAQPAEPGAGGAWWEMFQDSELNRLEHEADAANQNVKVAEANFRAARAQVAQYQATLFPTVTGQAGYSRARTSENLLFRSTAGRTVPDYTVGAQASWEPDLWGRIARSIEGAEASAEASGDDWQGARLSLQAELATDYFQLRSIDLESRLLRDAITAYTGAYDLTRHRFEGGIATEADVSYAKAQVDTTRAQALDLGVTRAQLEHAIAVLTGQAPSSLTLAPAPLPAPPGVAPPVMPVGVPSTLLERRPDIAAAERRVAAANAAIGVATAAFFPNLTLSVSGGLESSSLSNWLLAPARFWSLGPSLAAPLFDAGRRRAVRDQTLAQYDASVAQYRQTVLSAFQQVEDNLAALRILESEADAQDQAVRAARHALDLINNRYSNGAITLLEVTVAQTTELNNERAAVAIQRRRLAASVALVKAVGGGFGAATAGTASASTSAAGQIDVTASPKPAVQR